MEKFIILIVLVLAPLLMGAEKNTTTAIKDAYHKSFHYEQTQNYDDAINVLRPLLKTYPKEYTLHLRTGWLYYLSTKYSNSIAHYETAIKLYPTAIEPKLGIMLPHLAREQYLEVEQMAYQVLNLDFYNYYANIRLITALKKQLKYTLALNVTQKMLAIYPTDIALLTELATLYEVMEEREKAHNVFWSIITLDPENFSAQQALKK